MISDGWACDLLRRLLRGLRPVLIDLWGLGGCQVPEVPEALEAVLVGLR
jgi:hypothetical protein